MGPLQGVRVIELSHIMAGPTCGVMLADMGADVIKVEKTAGGDDSRRFTPPRVGEEAAAFMMLNRNKRGIALDLKTDAGKDALRRMLVRTDVVVENFRKGTMERLGLGYEHLRELNPALIYCEISGFGRTGPYAERAGFDLIAQGMSGLMSVTGEGPERPPVKCGGPVTDITAGILGAMGILAAYVHRLKTGQGQRVDTSLFEAGIVHTYWQSAIALATGSSPGPLGSAHPLNAPYQAFPTADGWITVGAANQRNWLKMLGALQATELADDPRFARNDGRMANLRELVETLNPLFRQHTTAYWLELLEVVGVPAGPILDVSQMHRDPQAQAREMVCVVEHSREGAVETIGHPVKYSETPTHIKRGAPLLGEHSRSILAEHGFEGDEIEELIRNGVALACYSGLDR
jgi:crotonobetainyl-CoA:carnitine CoA-transferase CaiB-like acyl-CoA transferase